MKNFPHLPDIPEERQTPLVKMLLGLLKQQATRIILLEETVAGLKDEINILKGEKKRPTFKPGGMENRVTIEKNQGVINLRARRISTNERDQRKNPRTLSWLFTST